MAVAVPTADARVSPGRALWERAVEARWPLSTAFGVGLLLLWQLAAVRGLPDYVLPPSQIAGALVEGVTEGTLLGATRDTLLRVLPGFVIGTSLGVAVGLVAGVVRVAEDVFDTLVSLTYPLPKISLFPLLVIWLGFTDRARILVIAISVFYPAFVNTFSGTKAIERRYVWVAQNLEAGRLRTFRQVVLPASLPSILVGVRISLALSFVLAFATEAIGAGRTGLGVEIQEGYNNLLYRPMYAAIAMFALLGLLSDVALRWVSARVSRGQRLDAVGRG